MPPGRRHGLRGPACRAVRCVRPDQHLRRTGRSIVYCTCSFPTTSCDEVSVHSFHYKVRPARKKILAMSDKTGLFGSHCRRDLRAAVLSFGPRTSPDHLDNTEFSAPSCCCLSSCCGHYISKTHPQNIHNKVQDEWESPEQKPRTGAVESSYVWGRCARRVRTPLRQG